MAGPSEPPPVKLVCGMLSARKDLFDEAAEEVARMLGPVDLVSDIMDFDFTRYYDAEMGSPLWRRFVSLAERVPPDALAEIKLRTNELEKALASKYACPRMSRPVNLDPGYIEPSKLVLASMKNFSHRIYLGRGVYAELTLMYRNGRWEPLPWTFPDYASGRYDAFLSAARCRLRRGQDKEAGR